MIFAASSPRLRVRASRRTNLMRKKKETWDNEAVLPGEGEGETT